MSGSEDDGSGAEEEMVDVDMDMPMNRPGANTGIKGVKADYADAKQRMQLRMMIENQKAWDEVNKVMVTSKQRGSSEEEEEEDSDDGEFLRQYREKKLEEMRQAAATKQSLPVFGALAELPAQQFVLAVDSEVPSVYIVVHLYDVRNPQCQLLNKIFSVLAIRHINTRFVKVVAAEALPDLDSIALPTVVVYKAGQQVFSWVRFLDQIQPISEDTVSLFLIENKVVSMDPEEQQILMHNVQEKAPALDFRPTAVDPKLLYQLADLLI